MKLPWRLALQVNYPRQARPTLAHCARYSRWNSFRRDRRIGFMRHHHPQLEKIMAEWDVAVDHAGAHRWALKILPALTRVFHQRKRPTGRSSRMDETHIKISGLGRHLHRAVDSPGHASDFLLTVRRDVAAARRFFEQVIGLHDEPQKTTIDKSRAKADTVHDRSTMRVAPSKPCT